MKTFFATSGRLAGLSMGALLALVVPAAQAINQPPSPVGTWDCTISGQGQSGIIFLNFTSDTDPNGLPTFEGIVAQAGHAGNKGANGRGDTSTGGRGSSGGSTNSIINIFGGGFINGSAGAVADNGGTNDWLDDSRGFRGNWFYNSKGQLIGSYYTVVNATGGVTNFLNTCIDAHGVPVLLTNGTIFDVSVPEICFDTAVLFTNIFWTGAPDGESGVLPLAFTNHNFTLGTIGETNSVSFVGKAVPGKRLTLVANSTFGKFTITGIPLQPVTTALAVDGFFWTGTKSQNGVKYVEEFTLTDTSIPNFYELNGTGPSYTYNGTNSFCLISRKKKIAFVVNEIGVNAGEAPGIRATCGPLTSTKKAIGTKGTGDSSDATDLINFNANLSPFVLP